MRKSRFTEDQMVKILREADKGPVADVAKKHGISGQTLYVWRKKYGQDWSPIPLGPLQAPPRSPMGPKPRVDATDQDLERRDHEGASLPTMVVADAHRSGRCPTQ